MDKETADKIKGHYMRGEGSIQDLARIYKFSVDEVLTVLGHTDMTEVRVTGDLIDQSEAGPEVKVNQDGTTVKVNYTVD